MTSRITDWQIAAEAADWAARIDAGALDADERASLVRWLKTSPAHVDELLFSASIMAGLSRVDAGKALSIDALLADISPEIIPLFRSSDASQAPDAQPDTQPVERRPTARRWVALAASVMLVLAISWYSLGSGPARDAGAGPAEAQIFATAGEEQRSFTLEDGSILHLNSASRAAVAFSETRRLVELLDGKALFDVAHDPDRPFTVLAAGAVVQAVGTKFTVEHGNGVVTVAVIEGEVLVGGRLDGSKGAEARLARNEAMDFSLGPQPARVSAGRRVQLFEARPTRTAEAVTSPVATRQLSFQDEGLAAIAAEFNRFNTVKIVVADPALANTRFSGVFDAHDPGSFIAFLELSADVRIERPNAGQIVLKAAD